jgi:hypothetical protein
MMEDPKRCPKCGHNAVRVRRVNLKGNEIGLAPLIAGWIFFGLSVLILIGSFFGSYGNASNHLVSAIPGIILVLVAVFYLFLFSRMRKRFRCDNAHTWDWP